MKRSDFLKRLGIGTAAAVVSPAVFAEAFKEAAPAAKIPEDGAELLIMDKTTGKVIARAKNHTIEVPAQIGVLYINDEPIMYLYEFNIKRELHELPITDYNGWRTYDSSPRSIRVNMTGSGLRDVDSLHEKFFGRQQCDCKIHFHDVNISFTGLVRSYEMTADMHLQKNVSLELDLVGAMTADPQELTFKPRRISTHVKISDELLNSDTL